MGTLTLSWPDTPPDSVAWLTVRDVEGSYTLPYIQSDRELRVCVSGVGSCAFVGAATLRGPAGVVANRSFAAASGRAEAVFTGLAAGEHELVLEAQGPAAGRRVIRRIGVGTVLAAVGDSLTEGYRGHGFMRGSLALRAEDFPATAVSRDGRNFPQFAPTAHRHQPEVNCFQSWMPALNDALAEAWGRPVFIANEGWGGYTAENTLAMMRGDLGGWGTRMRLLRPAAWLIHLGVNDERAGVPAAVFARNMAAIAECLEAEFGAKPGTVYIARPSFDYAGGAEPVLRGYIDEIDRLVRERNLRAGPDFFTAFSADKARWYGADPVHPGPEGMDLMARLWADVLRAGL